MKTTTRGALALLITVGLLLTITDRWGSLNTQGDRGAVKPGHAGPERTHDDRQRHDIQLVVRYRPARQISITWGIGEEGDREVRFSRDRPQWDKSRKNLPPATRVNLAVDNFDEGGYLNCEIIQDGRTVRHFNEEHTEHNDACDLTFVTGSK